MTNIQLIPLVLVLALTITVVNLFYKPWFFFGNSEGDSERWQLVNPFESMQCPLRGFKCRSPLDCNCTEICGNSFEKINVSEGEHVFVLDRKAEPGTYCLPRGVTGCDQKSSMAVYSIGGWVCVRRNEGVLRAGISIACKNDEAQENDSNVLWDYATEAKVVDSHEVMDFYERLPTDGEMRYRCKCESLDVRGNQMVNVLPFACSVDYCTRNLMDQPHLGWKVDECECGPFPHEDPNDKRSACVMERTRIEDGVLYGRNECTENDAVEMKAWWCPGGTNGVVSFRVRVGKHDDMRDFVTQLLENDAP